MAVTIKGFASDWSVPEPAKTSLDDLAAEQMQDPATSFGAVMTRRSSDYARYVRLDFGDTWQVNTQKIQSAIDSLKITSGTVYLAPNGKAAYTADAAIEVDKITHWSRIKVIGLGPNGVRLKARPGIPGSTWTCGATDGTDMNWHHGVLENIQFDGNKANQPAAPAAAITSIVRGPVTGIPTQSIGTTITTATAHGFALGDVVEVAGTNKVGAHGRWVVHQVGSPTTFVIIGPDNVTDGTGGTAQLVRNNVTVIRGGETSEISRIYSSNAQHSGFYYGPRGTPFRMIGCSAFHNNGYGYDLQLDRPLYMEVPSGDNNTLGFINVEAPAGVTYGQAALTVVSLKSEFQTSPVIIFRNWTGSAQIIGGAAEMATGNTSPAFRRIGSDASTIEIRGMRVDMRQAGTVFDDQSNAVQSRTTTHAYAFTYNDYLGPATSRQTERFAYMYGSSPTPYLDTASNFRLQVSTVGATVTVGTPLSYSPTFSPNVETITFFVQNTSTGDITVNWNSSYRVADWAAPAAGKARLATFKRFGSTWYMVAVTPDL